MTPIGRASQQTDYHNRTDSGKAMILYRLMILLSSHSSSVIMTVASNEGSPERSSGE